jgi:hypothetical protein
MSRGVQLPDLFDCLPPEEAQRELYHELETMRALSLQLLAKGRFRSDANQVWPHRQEPAARLKSLLRLNSFPKSI